MVVILGWQSDVSSNVELNKKVRKFFLSLCNVAQLKLEVGDTTGNACALSSKILNFSYFVPHISYFIVTFLPLRP